MVRLLHKADEYERYVIAHRLLTMDVEEAVEFYEEFHGFHHMTGKADLGQVPLSCGCKTNHAYAMCMHSTLIASVFYSDIRVLVEYVVFKLRC